jgi:hypothetical protein
MAFATLNDVLIPNATPDHRLCLSAIQELPRTTTLKLNTSLFFKCPMAHPILTLSAQDLYKIFRPAGLIQLVRSNANIGYDYLVSTISFHDDRAHLSARDLLKALLNKKRWPDCRLLKLSVSVSDPLFLIYPRKVMDSPYCSLYISASRPKM